MLFDAKDKILFIGDSIGDYDRGRTTSDNVNEWGTSYITNIACKLQARYPEKLFRIINVCTSGDQSRNLTARWEEDVLRKQPDWVCVMIGINDVWRQFDCPERPETWCLLDDYRKNMEKMITDTLPHVKGMILMTPYFMEQNRQDKMRAAMDAYGAVVKELGEKYGLLTLDIQKMWDDFFAKGLHPHAITWDMIHPNPVGMALLATTFLKAVGYEW